MKEIEEELYTLLKKLAQRRNDNFSGVGIVVYDEEKLDENCHCDLRPDFKLEKINIEKDILVDKLIEYVDYKSDLHDGFCFMNQDGDLTHIAQYYVPTIKEKIFPNQNHGVRTYSAACGSKMEGVKCIGLVSSNNDIFIYKDGEEYINDTNYIIED